MKREFQLFDRREFFGAVTRTAAAFGVTAAVVRADAASPGGSNPFAYDLSRVQKTDPKLIAYEQVARWNCPRKDTRHISIGPGDRPYLCAGNYVSAVDGAGHPEMEIATSGVAGCSAVTTDGTVFVGVRDHVEVFDAKGQRRTAWDSPDRKSWFTSVAVGGKDVFVADAGKRVVLRYDHDGKLIGRIGTKDRDRNVPGFIVPSPYLGVVIHPDGLLRVNNPGRHRVELYTFDGDFEGSWGKPSAAIEGFCGCCNPIALALLSDGRFVTCEKGLPRVKIYSRTGELECVVAGVESFSDNARACSGLNDCAHGGLDAAVDSRGRIHILDFVTNEVLVMQRKA